VLLTARRAHIPRSVLPSVPRLVWILMLLGAGTAALAGGKPFVTVGSTHVGLGGVLSFLQVTVLSVVLLGLGGLVSWTTNVAEIAPAVATLGRPLRWLRIPVDEWAVTLALALRAFPMLIDEYRVLFAARRLRPREQPEGRRARRKQRSAEFVDLLAAAITVALRRGDEMGDAITARGGVGQIVASPTRPGRADAMALLLVTAMCALSVYVEMCTPLATHSH
jgi:energy-coupling factor transport system permease protein